MPRSISVIYATSTGHTEFVVDRLVEVLQSTLKDARIIRQRAEMSTPEDLTKSDILILACGTWNTGNVEGQLHPDMHALLNVRAAGVDLTKVRTAVIGLGDDRYHFTARATGKLCEWLHPRHGTLLLPALAIINDPYDQTKKIETWVGELASVIGRSNS